jgi:LAS superfamily LD-carboxypeptidase LdcB
MIVTSPTSLALVGQHDAHLTSEPDHEAVGARLHVEALAPFLSLREAAHEAGFDLRVLSAYRGFERQASIWNRKARGELPVLDSQARPLDIATLSPRELAFAILRWSALPGASRHHWGTDLDVYDAATTPDGYEIQLIPAEVNPGGMHGALHEWLDARIAAGTAFGFYRPYDADRGGVAPERWHLSYAPVATAYLRLLTPTLLRDTVASADLMLKDVVLEHLDEIHVRFVLNVSAPPTLPAEVSA